MFELHEESLPASILDCGAGPSSFCPVACERGVQVVAVDPLYRYSAEEIEERFRTVTPRILSMMEENEDQFVFDRFESPEDVVEGRHQSMQRFLDDYTDVEVDGRYRGESIEDVEFDDGEFQLALSSHFLFLYGELLSTDFHLRSVREILRVADEFRVFPLTNLQAESSSHVKPVKEQLTSEGYEFDVRDVDYEFQKNSNQMLIISQ